jgi:uncharacterized membrane protein YcaP (DUF421 family)
MLVVFFRALILYAVMFIVIRLMGKKELSKVQPFELAIIILISDLASSPMSSRGVSIFDGIVPIITLLIMYLIFTLLVHSSNKVEDFMCGKVIPIIRDGKIIEENFDKNKYTIEDIMSQLREQEVFKIQDVKFAMIENNGNLSVIKNSDNFNSIPLNVIEDGMYSKDNLEMLKMNEKDVDKLLRKNKLKVEDVLVGTMDENSNFIFQLKNEVNNK